MTAEPAVRAFVSYQPAAASTVHTFTLPTGIVDGDALVVFVAGANTLNVDPVKLTVGGSVRTELAQSRRSGASNLIAYVIPATGSMASTSATFQKVTASNSFRVAIAAVVLANVSTSVSGQASNLQSAATTKTTASTSIASRSVLELSAVMDLDTTSPATALWTPPTGVTKLAQAALGPAGGSSPWVSVAVGMANSRAYGGSVGSRVWTADQANGGATMTVALDAPVTPARHLRTLADGWQVIEQVGA